MTVPFRLSAGSITFLGNSGTLLQLSIAVALVAVAALVVFELFRAPDELRPLSAAKLTTLPEFGGDYKDQMLWGSYRPGLYFGMRTRCACSLQGTDPAQSFCRGPLPVCNAHKGACIAL